MTHVYPGINHNYFGHCVSSRWFGQSRLSPQGLSEVARPFRAKIFERETPATTRTQTEQEKYRRAQQAFGRISGELAQFKDEAFDSAMNQFDILWHNLRQGQITVGQARHSVSGEGNNSVEGSGEGCGGDSSHDGGCSAGGGVTGAFVSNSRA